MGASGWSGKGGAGAVRTEHIEAVRGVRKEEASLEEVSHAQSGQV